VINKFEVEQLGDKMYKPLFSTYSQGENRVTSTILAVLERLPFALTEIILMQLMDEPDEPLVTFQNQPSNKNSSSIPDAKISSCFSFWIETKIVANSVNLDQINRHIGTIKNELKERNYLLILTPDKEQPNCVTQLNTNPKIFVKWRSFEDFIACIKDLINSDDNGFLLIREHYLNLLYELIHFITQEKLLDSSKNRVQIVAAKTTWPDYCALNNFSEGYSAYICQPNRRFQPAEYLGFYVDNEIKSVIPNVIFSIEEITLTEEGISLWAENQNNDDKEINIIKILNALLAKMSNVNNPRTWWNSPQKVMILSSKNSGDTKNLNINIKNDLVFSNGNIRPLTYGQPRYFDLNKLKKAKKTSELNP
jgi:hypothetical protein